MAEKLLLIETATSISSVAVCRGEQLLSAERSDAEQRHTEEMLEMILRTLRVADLRYEQLDGIVVSAGPGSYTGLRIGVSLSKGLCYALDIPLLAASTLEIMAAGFLKRNPNFKGFVCPMLDARRMEVYTAVFDHTGKRLVDDQPAILGENMPWTFSKSAVVCFIGNGVSKSMELLSAYPNAVFEPEGVPLAADITSLATRMFKQQQFEDLAWFEPAYLKPFQGKPKA